MKFEENFPQVEATSTKSPRLEELPGSLNELPRRSKNFPEAVKTLSIF